ncbi:hypothetical protein MN608_08750 [Microdochium nivale]|nr:hypothetical protein MN608_08750 [Microdochium nivale]
MSNMSRVNSATSLMGFSVHQPQLGTMLEFFPAMGSQQLDDMIDAYVPGNMSILDKRAAVTMEFFEHSMSTGELFKFFMVYPANVAESPASSLQDSGYSSSAFASPVVSETRWSASTSKKARIGGASGTSATAVDFSHIPGMKIMTRDGQDVTNSASRGCKTKEQRDHAHLMRIMKACESCKKKKIRCDPSHKRASIPVMADSKVKKASKRSALLARTIPSSVPPIVAGQAALDISSDAFVPSFDVAEQDSWEQFVAYDEEDFVAAPSLDVSYDFFFDPAGHFSPSASFTSGFNSGSSSSSASPSQSFIHAQSTVVSAMAGVGDGSSSRDAEDAYRASGFADASVATMPYMSSDGFDSSHYVDFALYSPESSSSSDDDLSSYSHELKASSSSPYDVSRRGGAQVESRTVLRSGSASSTSQVATSDAGLESRSAFAQMEPYCFDLGTDQGPELISGVRHSRRPRVLAAAHSDSEQCHGVGLSNATPSSSKPRMSESLVPCDPQDVPRPPDSPQSSAAGTTLMSPSDANHAGAGKTKTPRTRSPRSRMSYIATAASARSALSRERLGSCGLHTESLVMGFGLDDLHGARLQQTSANATRSSSIAQNVNGKTTGASIPQHSSDTTSTSTTPSGARQPLASSGAAIATVANTSDSSWQSTTCPVSYGSVKATSGAVAAHQYRDPGSMSGEETQADHTIVSVGRRALLSSEHMSGSGSRVQAQRSVVEMHHNNGLAMTLFVLAVLALGLFQGLRARFSIATGGSFLDFAAILTLSAAAAAHKILNLVRLRSPSAGPLKSSLISLPSPMISNISAADLRNAQSTIVNLSQRLGRQLGLPRADMVEVTSIALRPSTSVRFVSLR